MNDDLQPLALLLAQAERQRYDALAEQLKAETAKRAAEVQAEQLVAYRREYEQRWSARVLPRRQDRARPLLPGLRPAPDAGGRAAAARRRARRGAGRARRGDRARSRGARCRPQEADRAAPAPERGQRRSQRAEGKRRPRRARVVEPPHRARPGALPVSVAMNTGSARGASVAAPLVGAPIVQAAPTPADKPAPAGAQPASNRFAELLRRNRAEAPKPAAPEPTPAARADASADRGEAGDTSSIEAKAAPANAAKARAATPKATTEKASGEDQEQGSDKSDAVCGDDGSDDADRIDRPASTMAPADRLDSRPASALAIDTLRRIASLRAPPGATTRPEPWPKIAMPPPPSARRPRTAAGMPAAWHRSMRPTTARTSPVDASRDTALRVAADARLQLASGDTRAARLDSPAATTAHDRGVDALTASLGVGAASRGADPAAATTAAPALALATPVDAPDFASALGVRVSVLVQDGVQQAELHLNPAETGPVSIHISLDGTAARVDFGADVAATRAAIERGLPELASALRDAGFTLAGGGVSQHAGGRAQRRRRRQALDGAARRRRQPRRDPDRRRFAASRARSRRRRRRPLRLTRRRRRRGAVWARKASLIAASGAGPVSIISFKARELRNPAQALPRGASMSAVMANPAVDAPVTRRPKKKLIVIGAAVLALVLALGAGAVVFLKQRAAHAAAPRRRRRRGVGRDRDAGHRGRRRQGRALLPPARPLHRQPRRQGGRPLRADRHHLRAREQHDGRPDQGLHAGDQERGPDDPRQQDLEGPAQPRRQGAARAGDPARGGAADGHRDRRARAGDDGAGRRR